MCRSLPLYDVLQRLRRPAARLEEEYEVRGEDASAGDNTNHRVGAIPRLVAVHENQQHRADVPLWQGRRQQVFII